jgi:predicted permease
VKDDITYALRSLLRAPLAAAALAATVSIGVGANGAIFTLANGIWLRPSPVFAPARLAAVYKILETLSGPKGLTDLVQVQECEALASSGVVTGGVACEFAPGALTQEANPVVTLDNRRLAAVAVSSNYFRTLGVPLLGVGFRPDDDAPGAPPVAVLSQALWRARFGADGSIVGRPIRLGAVTATVVGVVANQFRGPLIGDRAELWIPLSTVGAFATVPTSTFGLAPARTYERLTSARTLEQMQTATALELNRPVVLQTLATSSYHLHAQSGSAADRRLLTLLAATATLVLLIGCVNIVGLIRARSEKRRQEVAIRLALGISRHRLARLLLMESVLAGLIGGLGALLVSRALVAALTGLVLPSGVAIGDLDIAVNWTVCGYTLTLALVASVACGVGPAIRAGREGATSLGRLGSDVTSRSSRVGRPLVVIHVALSVVLLIGAAFLVRSVHRAMTKDFGFDADHLIDVTLQPRIAQYAKADGSLDVTRRNNDIGALLDRFRGAPGILAVTNGDSPIEDLSGVHTDRGLVVDGQRHDIQFVTMLVGQDYFETVGTTILAGRDVRRADTLTGATPIAIVNHALASALWASGPGIGHHVTVNGQTAEVVAVVADAVRGGVRASPSPALFVPSPLLTDRVAIGLLIRTQRDADSLVPEVSDVALRIFPNAPLVSIVPGREEILSQFASERLGAALFSTFGLVGFVMCLLGVYSLVAFITSRRAREMAIRMSLGTEPRPLVRGILWRGLRAVGLGCVLGAGAAVLLMGVLRSYLFELSRWDFVSLLGPPLMVLSLSGLAIYTAGSSVCRLNVVDALRQP